MYNDEHSLYHYTYRKDGSETEARPAPRSDPPRNPGGEPERPPQEKKPARKSRVGLKITALALCCALLGGAVGGGVVWAVAGREAGGTSADDDNVLPHGKSSI